MGGMSVTASQIVLVVDVANHLHADFHAAGDHAGRAFERRMEAIYKHIHPARVACAFESTEPTFRHQLEAGYKANRDKPDPALVRLFDEIQDFCLFNEWDILESPGFEADDIIATVTRIATEADHQVVISSRDKDCRQLLRAGLVSILRSAKVDDGKLQCEWLTEQILAEKEGLTPAQWLDYQCLVGDATDCITGAKGIGDKTAKKILQEAGSLEQAYANPWGLSITQRLQDNLLEFRKRLDLVRQLVTLKTDVPLELAI